VSRNAKQGLRHRRKREVVAVKQESQDTEMPVFDLQELLNRCLGNLDFAERILTKFQSRSGDDIEEIERAIAAEDVDAVAAIAHRLKGASATAAANGICSRASEIEELARRRVIAEIPPRLQALRSEWSQFAKCVSSLGSSSDAG
jgi:HPt (histidine-containing phosphotransfer) domain-containing protein